jgi:fucose permease
VLSLASFVLLGLPDGMLGTAWPAMRVTFAAPVGDLGLILLATTCGSIVVTAFVGALIRRLGVPALLTAAGLSAAASAAGYALAPGLGLVLGVAVLTGVAAGLMDGGLNTAVALAGRSRLLNLLHGFYGVGTAIGPLIVTAAILTGSWRPAYWALFALNVIIASCWLLRRRRQGRPDPAGPAAAGPPAGPQPTAPLSRRRYGAVLVTGMTVFFVYTGLEVAAGQWETSYARGHLHLPPSAAGLATAGYWAALTAGPIGLALVPRLAVPRLVTRYGGLVALAAAAVIWWQPGIPATVAAFVVLGGALAGIFPAQVTLTPARLGDQRAQHVIAWQVGAAAGGGAGISALIGLLIGVAGFAVLGLALTVLALLLVGLELGLSRLAPPAG